MGHDFQRAAQLLAVPTLTAAACATERLRLGTLVTSVNPRSPITA
jgi:alkanesulfonate monooxygenase SsuD/methylene tetrahydromethanopterin reductase-like flavin-dependent oxidoreductase (luciferase family)